MAVADCRRVRSPLFAEGLKLALAASLLVAPLARAGKPSATAIALSAPPSGSSQVGADVALLQAIATHAVLHDERLAGIDAAERIDATGAAGRGAAAREGLARSKAGHAAYDNLDLAEAIKDFGDAAQAYVGADARRSFGAYIEALVWQAASRWVNGDKQGARAELARVFAEDPGVELDKSAFPPDLMEEADRDRGDAESQAKVDLEVTCAPPALIWIDGKPVGPSPLTVKVIPGRHLVAASAPGYGLASTRSVGTRVHLDLTPIAEAAWLSSERKTLGSKFESGDRADALKAIVDRLAVDQVVALALEDEGGERSLVAVRVAGDGHVLAFVRQSLTGTTRDAAAAVMKEVLAADLPRGSGDTPITDTGLSGGGGGPGQHGLAYVVGGIGAAGVIAGTIFGVVELHDRSSYTQTPQTNTGLSQTWEQIGNRNAVISDVADIVGVVGLGVAAAIWFWPQSGGSTASSTRTEVLGVAPVLLPGGGGLLSATGRF
jgi:hypothetical protein